MEDTQVKKRKTKMKNKSEEDNIYKMNFDQEDFGQDYQEQKDKNKEEKLQIQNDDAIEENNNKNIIKVVDDDDEIDEIFGNVNRWLTDDKLEEKLKDQKEKEEKKTKKKKLTKIEDGIKSSKTTKKTNTKTTKKPTTKKNKTEKETKNDDIYGLEDLSEIKEEKIEENVVNNETQDEIKIHAENGMTEILLRHNQYKIELQKLEYNIYTENSDTSYIIVRDPNLRIVSNGAYIIIKKQGEDYEINTNQDFKINYVIDNLERKNNIVNFKLTNLTEIVANEEGLNFVIDEEKVIENNLEDNKTLVISEEDGKVYLPYTKEDIKNEAGQNKGIRISEIIENKYILPLDKYKNSIRARFREGYNLMYKREGKSRKSAILLGIELMFETNLHPAIISACKNLEELDIYLDCLEDNELEKFSCFKIIYKSLPTLRTILSREKSGQIMGRKIPGKIRAICTKNSRDFRY